jgi:hypothetical protein
MKIYLDNRDWWVGWYRGTEHHYICLLPCIVLRVTRKASATPPA